MLRPANAATVYLAYATTDGFLRGLLFTFLTAYFVLRVGMDPFRLVLIGTILEATIMFFEVPTGVIADAYSRRLSIVIGQSLFGFAYILQGTFPVFGVIAVVEAVRAIGETCLSGALQAWAGGEVSPEKLTRLFLRGVQVRRAGRLAGIVASTLLVNVDLQLPLLLGGVLALATGAVLALAMPERGFTRPAPAPARDVLLTTLRSGVHSVARSRVLLLFLALAMILGAASEGVDRLWEAHLLEDYSLPALGALDAVSWFGLIEAGGMLISIGVVQVVARVPITEVPRIAAIAAAAHAIRALAIGLFALAGPWQVAIGARWLQVAATGVSGPLIDAWLVRNTPSHLRATVFSTLSQGDAFGQTFGGPIFGVIGTLQSLRAAILASALVILPGVGLLGLAARASGTPAHEIDSSPSREVSVQ